jgi:anaphase-promoting complex subunit 1
MALGLIFLKTEDMRMAEKLAPVNSRQGIEALSPELCLLRVELSSLIVWSTIKPSRDWVYSTVPQCLLRLIKGRERHDLAPGQIRFLTMNFGFCVAGAVLAMGHRFVGSLSADARCVILAELKGFVKGEIGTSGVPMSAMHKGTNAFQPCVNACAIALGLVMAGSGDSGCLKGLRKLSKVSSNSYGTHMAIAMAIGFLFLGGGRLTLSNSTPSVATQIVATYPVWPRDPSDNVKHLQILRHLYALAAANRVMEAVDVLTNKPVSVPVRVVLQRGRMEQQDHAGRIANRMWTPVPKGMESQTVSMVTPCLLPDPSTIASIEVRSSQHHSLTVPEQCIGNGSLIVRVLEKQHLWRSSEEGSSAQPEEQYCCDWVRRVFSSDVSPMESVVILDNLQLLLVFSDRVMVPQIKNRGTSTSRVAFDVLANISRTLDDQFAPLLDTTTKVRGEIRRASQSPQVTVKHPLHLLLLDGHPAYDVAHWTLHGELLSAPDGSTDRPHYLTEVIQKFVEDGRDVHGFALWLTQSLRYYGLPSTCPLHSEVSKFIHQRDAMNPPTSNRGAVEIMRFSLQHKVRLHVMEHVMLCCT